MMLDEEALARIARENPRQIAATLIIIGELKGYARVLRQALSEASPLLSDVDKREINTFIRNIQELLNSCLYII